MRRSLDLMASRARALTRRPWALLASGRRVPVWLLKLQNAHHIRSFHRTYGMRLFHMRHGDRARVHTVIRAGPGALVTTQLASRYLVR